MLLFSLSLLDVIIIIIIWSYIKLSTDVFVYYYLKEISYNDYYLKKHFNTIPYYAILIFFILFGFIVYIPFIKKILYDFFEYHSNLSKLKNEILKDNEIILLKRKIFFYKNRKYYFYKKFKFNIFNKNIN